MYKNIAYPLSVTHTLPQEIDKRVKKVAADLDIDFLLSRKPSQLSIGQQQRVAIARAIVNGPKILICDEPTGNLDSKTSEEVLQMFQELNAKEGLTIVLVTHSPEVGAFAKEAYHIKDGLMVDGTY